MHVFCTRSSETVLFRKHFQNKGSKRPRHEHQTLVKGEEDVSVEVKTLRRLDRITEAGMQPAVLENNIL